MTIVSAYNPLPPTPCKVLNIINSSAVLASPEAKEKHVNMKKEEIIIVFRPKTSESLVTNTAHAISAKVYDSAAQMVFW